MIIREVYGVKITPSDWSDTHITHMYFAIRTVPFEWSTTATWKDYSAGPSGFVCLVTRAFRERSRRLSIQKFSGRWTCMLG